MAKTIAETLFEATTGEMLAELQRRFADLYSRDLELGQIQATLWVNFAMDQVTGGGVTLGIASKYRCLTAEDRKKPLNAQLFKCLKRLHEIAEGK